MSTSLSTGFPLGLDLHRLCACCHSLCKFICALILLCSSLSSIPSACYNLLPSSWAGSHLERFHRDIPLQNEGSKVSHLQLWVFQFFVCLFEFLVCFCFVSCMRKLFWWWLIKELLVLLGHNCLIISFPFLPPNTFPVFLFNILHVHGLFYN